MRHTVGTAAVLVCTLCFSASAVVARDVVDMDAARKEGKVVWYTSTPIEKANKIAKMFETATSIKVELFRSGGSAVLGRFMQERQAGQIRADVLTASDPAGAEAMARNGLFVAFKPKDFDKVPETARNKDGYFVAQRLNLISIYARSDKVPEKDLPRTWTDLLDPKYKGMMVMTDPSFTALQLSVVGMISKKYGWDFYRNLHKNDVMIVQGNQQVSEALKRGERLIAVGASDSYAADDRKKGHPLVTIFPTDGAFVIPSPTAVIKGGPNPNAAKAFAEFQLTMAVQKLLPEEGGYAARIDVDPPEGNPPLSKINTIGIDDDMIEKEAAQIKKRFNEIFQ
jgi:iron(III) transport system substrate-binding protein